jgi:hypothetical protein
MIDMRNKSIEMITKVIEVRNVTLSVITAITNSGSKTDYIRKITEVERAN